MTGGSYINATTVYKFHVDWDRISLSTFTGPFLTPISPTSVDAVLALRLNYDSDAGESVSTHCIRGA